MDEALVPHARRLRIRRSNFRLLSDIKSKESTLQLVYDVLRLSPFFKAFLVTADVLKIYMQELWATATVHHHSIRLPHQPFVEPPFEEEILAFLQFLGHSGAIRRLTDTRSSSDTTITPPTAAAGPRLTTSKKGKQAAKASNAKSLSALSEVAMTEAPQLKLATKKSLQQTHISQVSGSDADEGTGSIPGVLDVPTDESEEEISWNSTDVEGQDDDDDDAKDDDDQEDKGNDEDDEEEGSDDEQASDKEEFIHHSLSTHAEEETRDEESFDPISKTPENTNDEGNGEQNLGANVGREKGHDEEEEEEELYRDVNINLGRGIQMGDVHQTQDFEDSHVTLTLVNPDGQHQSSSVSLQFVTSMLNPTPDAGMESIFETTSQMDVQIPTSVAPLPVSAPTITPSTIATVVCIGSSAVADSLVDICRDLEPCVDLPALLVAFSCGVLDDSGSFPSLRLLDPRSDPAEGSSSLLASSSRRLFNVIVSPYVSKMILSDSYASTRAFSISERSEATAYEVFDELDDRVRTSASSAVDQPIVEPSQHPVWFSQQKKPTTPDRDWNKTLLATHGSIQPWISDLAKLSNYRSSFNELMDTPVNPEGQQYPYNLLKHLPLIPNSRGRRVIPFDHFINNDLEYLRGGASSRKYTASVTKTKAADYGHIKWIEDLVPRTMWIQEPIGYDKHALWDDDKLYKFKEGDFKRLRIQDKEDMLLLLVQGKLTTLTVEERFAFNVSLRMFTRSIVIQRNVEDLQLGVESYQEKLNLTKPDTYRSDLKRKEAYIADGTLTDVRTAQDDRLKGIRMMYLPQSIWRKSDKDRAAAMIQTIDKRLKTRRIMRSLERFVGGRQYEGDFRMLQRTI
nr:hypothetical protein [Tanacetum cinerariifolium]